MATRVEGIFSGFGGFCRWIYFHIIDFLAPYLRCIKYEQYSILHEWSCGQIAKLNDFLEQRRKIREMVDQNFVVVEKNVENLDEARVILVGETHSRDDHRINNGGLIDALSEKDDLLLVEESEKDPHPEKTNQIRHVRKPLAVGGWDVDKIAGLEPYVASTPLFYFGIAMICAWPFGTIVGSLSLLASLVTRTNGLRQIINGIPERNRNLCRVIQRSIRPGNRIFVIAGSAHLAPLKILKWKKSLIDQYLTGIDMGNVDRAYTETTDYLKGEKFAILIPKRD